MERIRIYLHVPYLNQRYELYVPTNLQLSALLQIITEALKEITNNTYVSDGKEMLCRKKTNNALSYERTLSSYSIKNGEEIVLM